MLLWVALTTGEVSTDVIDALVDELNPQGRFSTLPSADDVISRLNRKARRVKTDSSDSDGFGPSYADEKKIRTGMRRKDKEPKPARQATSRMEVEQAKPKSAGLSIDDIIRKHSGAVNSAVENAKENARRSTASSPILPSPPDLTPTVSPRVVKRSQCLSEEVCEDDSDADVRANLAMGQALLDKLETASITSSRTSLRYSQTPPRIHRQSLPSSRPSIDDDSHNLAVYLRSSRLNRYIHLPRPFPERPLHVSLADLGSPTGTPVVIFLGIGCVRHLIALFDDLAKALNLRLICIDRWGFGKTTNVPQEKRNPLDWAAVVERVLDELKVDTFRIIAHSAGAPYAAATALRMGERVQGKMHFLAPWISADIDGGESRLGCADNRLQMAQIRSQRSDQVGVRSRVEVSIVSTRQTPSFSPPPDIQLPRHAHPPRSHPDAKRERDAGSTAFGEFGEESFTDVGWKTGTSISSNTSALKLRSSRFPPLFRHRFHRLVVSAQIARTAARPFRFVYLGPCARAPLYSLYRQTTHRCGVAASARTSLSRGM